MDTEFLEEQKLRNEVIYLHSLWHQGPPLTHNPTVSGSANLNVPFANNDPYATARPAYPNPRDIGRHYQHGSNFFERKRKDRGEMDTWNVLASQSEPAPSWDSGPEWPCPEPVEEKAGTKSEWPALESRASKVSRIASDEERSRHIAWEMQYKAFDSCMEFFQKKVICDAFDSDSDGSLDVEDDDDDDDDDDVSEDCEEYKFFLNIFVEDCELRNYYEKNYKCGEFFCLVCGGTGKKSAKKRFKDGNGLVQHSLTISNTPKRRAHRAFGKVICTVLGWDVNRLPAIVLKGETLGQLLKMKQCEAEGKHKEIADGGKDNVGILHVCVNHYSESCEETSNQVVLCEDSAEVVDGSCNTENNDQKILNSEADKGSEEDKVGDKRSEDDLKESLDVIDESIVSVNGVGGTVEQGQSAVNQTSVEPVLSEVANKTSEDDPEERLNVLKVRIVSVNDIGEAVKQGVSAVNWTSNVLTLCEVRKKMSEDDRSLDVLDECNVFVNDVAEAVEQVAPVVNQTINVPMLCEDSHEGSHIKNDSASAEVNNGVPMVEGSNHSPAIEIKWPCEISSDNMSSSSGWPATKPHLTFPKYIISPEEQATVAALQMQQKVRATCKAFFAGNPSSDIDEGDDDTETSEDEEEMDDDNTSEACEEFKFLLKLFTEEDEIRKYYENHSKEGNFYCLVCGGIGKKAWKTFKGCIGLLQHANSILKTEKKRAHRAYVQVICKLLGWDFDRLPAIVLKGEPLGISLAKSATENRELS